MKKKNYLLIDGKSFDGSTIFNIVFDLSIARVMFECGCPYFKCNHTSEWWRWINDKSLSWSRRKMLLYYEGMWVLFLYHDASTVTLTRLFPHQTMVFNWMYYYQSLFSRLNLVRNFISSHAMGLLWAEYYHINKLIHA